MAKQWFEYPIGVPFGNPNYDVALGGSHDMTILAPANYPVTSIVTGDIATINDGTWSSNVAWGKQVTIKLDSPVNGHAYFAFLHLSAVNPALKVGSRVDMGTLIGWVGGATSPNQYIGTSNPTGLNFLNTPAMSSQVQVGIALCDGPEYGGLGWKTFPPIDMTLSPVPILTHALNALEKPVGQPIANYPMERASMIWQATNGLLKATTGNTARIGTGIYQMWESLLLNGKYMLGPPVTQELPYITTTGVSGIIQFFLFGCIVDCPRGQLKAYDGLGRLI